MGANALLEVYGGSPGGELSPKVTEGWFHAQSLKIICRERSTFGLRAAFSGWPPKRVCGRSDRSGTLWQLL